MMPVYLFDLWNMVAWGKPASFDRINNTPGTDFLSFNSKRAGLIEKQMSETPYCLNESAS